MPLQEFILELTKWAAAFSLLTLIVHLLQTRIIKEWRAETNEILVKMDERSDKQNQLLAKMDERSDKQNQLLAKMDERSERQSQMLMRMEETQRYVAELVKIEGEKTREVIQDRL